MRKYIVFFLILCSFCSAASLRVAVLTDLHATNEGTDGTVVVGDGSSVRVFSNWSQRLTEFITAAKLYNADIIMLLGDNIDTSCTDKNALWGTVLDQIASEWGDNDFVTVLGNHERVGLGGRDPLTVVQFATQWSNKMAASWAKVSGSWPGLAFQKKVSSYIYNINSDFGILALTGNLKDGASTVWTDHWDSNIQDYDGTDDATTSLLGWIDSSALGNLGTRHAIVINHHPLQSNPIGLDLPDRIISGDTNSGDPNLQSQLSNHSQPVTYLSGHYHFVRADGPKFVLDTTISNVNDLWLRGSVLGENASDMRGNTFFIVDIDKVNGPGNIRTFQYSKTARDRYYSTDLDHIIGTHRRSRSR